MKHYDFKLGDLVYENKFGIGCVVDLDSDDSVTISFDSGIIKIFGKVDTQYKEYYKNDDVCDIDTLKHIDEHLEFEDFEINDIVRHEEFGIGHVEQLSIDDHTIFVIFEDGYSTWFSELFGVANHTIDTLTKIHNADEPKSTESGYKFKIYDTVFHEIYGFGVIDKIYGEKDNIRVAFNNDSKKHRYFYENAVNEEYKKSTLRICRVPEKGNPEILGFDPAYLEPPVITLEPKLCASDCVDAQRQLYYTTLNPHIGVTGVKNDDSIDAMGYFVANMKEKGDNNMKIKNEVLKLYEERELEKIQKDYEKAKDKFIRENELVKKYNSIVATFKEAMDELYTSKENMELNCIIGVDCGQSSTYLLTISKLADIFDKEHGAERSNKERDLKELIKEVNAQLSMSDDVDYQVKVLTRYDILTKTTKKMVR